MFMIFCLKRKILMMILCFCISLINYYKVEQIQSVEQHLLKVLIRIEPYQDLKIFIRVLQIRQLYPIDIVLIHKPFKTKILVIIVSKLPEVSLRKQKEKFIFFINISFFVIPFMVVPYVYSSFLKQKFLFLNQNKLVNSLLNSTFSFEQYLLIFIQLYQSFSTQNIKVVLSYPYFTRRVDQSQQIKNQQFL